VRGRVLAGVAAFALAAAGCGGDGGDGGDGGRLSKAELIQRADEICAEYNLRNDRLRRRGPAVDPTNPNATEETRRQAADVLRKLADNVRAQADELRGLEPPAAASAGFNGLIARHGEFAEHLDAAAEAAEENRRRALIRELSAAQEASPIRDPFPAQYGFEVCGRVPRQEAA
jgi:hypothetical protein